jgi:hypothetical protein
MQLAHVHGSVCNHGSGMTDQCAHATVKERCASLDALEQRACPQLQTLAQKRRSVCSSQDQHAEDAMPARFFRSAERMRVRIATLHTVMPC